LGEKVMWTAGGVVRWEGQVRVLFLVVDSRNERGKMKEAASGEGDVFVEEGVLMLGSNLVRIA
jgi:hypothetical protein